MKRVKELKHHILVALQVGPVMDSIIRDTHFSAVDRSGRHLHLGSVKEQTNTEGFLVLLEEEGMRVDEQRCAEIVDLFQFMHLQKKVIECLKDLDQPGVRVRKGKKDRVKLYANVIRPPLFSVEEGDVRKITFSTIDHWTGDLEQWDIAEDSGGKLQIENKVLEPGLILVLRP